MIDLKDTIRLAQTVSDGYGDTSVEILTEIDCLFLQSTSNSHSNNTEVVQADSHVYLDPFNSILVENGYRIEGMYIIANPLGSSDDESWYKITRVVVGQRKLLDNDIDNIHCFLQKVAKLEVSNVVS